jgi:hypothetical protein
MYYTIALTLASTLAGQTRWSEANFKESLQRPRNAAWPSARKVPLALFRAVMAGEHVIVGFRNTHIQKRLWHRPPLDPIETKRRCAHVSRQLTKLRGHGLIAKVPRHRLYRVTPYGQRVMTAAIAHPRSRIPIRLRCCRGLTQPDVAPHSDNNLNIPANHANPWA